MPPRPFPLPLSTGTDICSVSRIFHLLNRSATPQSFSRRILTPRELKARWGPMAGRVERWVVLRRERERERKERGMGMGGGGRGYETGGAYARSSSMEGGHEGREKGGWDEVVRREGFVREQDAVANDGGFADTAKTEIRKLATEIFGSTVTDAVNGMDALARRGCRRGEDVEGTQSTVASGNAAEEEPATAIHRQESKEENKSVHKTLETIDAELDKLFPEIWNVAQFLAGRFAAKEAAIKAYQFRRLTYHDIEIISPPQKEGRSQAPIAMVKPEDGDWDNAQIIPMSISHDGGFATAVCMAYENSTGTIV